MLDNTLKIVLSFLHNNYVEEEFTIIYKELKKLCTLDNILLPSYGNYQEQNNSYEKLQEVLSTINEKGLKRKSKVYTNCSAYGDKTKDLENLKQGDFVKIFGQVKTSIDNNGKEHKNVRILSSKLLKAKEQVKSQDKDKKSILGQIKSFKTDDKTKSNKKDHSKDTER